MNEFDNISDEQLACFIEDNLCEVDCNFILDTVSCDADMDVLSIAYQASKLADDEAITPTEIIDLPRWNSGMVAACTPAEPLYQSMRECAFLGDNDMTDACCDSLESDNESEEI